MDRTGFKLKERLPCSRPHAANKGSEEQVILTCTVGFRENSRYAWFSLRLAIEVDGSHHRTPWMAEFDGVRTDELLRRGIRVLRVPNELLIRDPQMVANQISEAIERAKLGR